MGFKADLKYKVFNKRGWFIYFGEKIFFPKNSLIFRMACDQGIYDALLLRLIRSFLKPGTTFFDIGTNIGLISVPVLTDKNFGGRVISVEPTPEVLQYLRQTRSGSKFNDRWTLFECAIADFNGEVDFSVKPELDTAYYGVSAKDGSDRSIRVACKTLDEIWEQSGKPVISVIKIDIEGFDFYALKGGTRAIAQNRPVIFIEWYGPYISKYGVGHADLLNWCRTMGYRILCLNSRLPVTSVSEMQLQQDSESNFILLPSDSQAPAEGAS